MSVSPQTLVVIPTYNEAENLPRMTEALFHLGISNLELLVVDDDSPDGTGKIAEQLCQSYGGRVHVLHRAAKSGLGPAYMAGFKHALQLGAQNIIQMDADFSHQPQYIPQLLEALQHHDAVIGSRFIAGGGVDEKWSLIRKLLSWWANRIYTPTILQIPIYDATGGFRAWRRETLIGMNLDQIRSNGYVFQVEMVYVAHRLGYHLVEIPIYFPDRKHGQSKMDTSIALEAALRVWQIRARHHHLTPRLRHQPDSV